VTLEQKVKELAADWKTGAGRLHHASCIQVGPVVVSTGQYLNAIHFLLFGQSWSTGQLVNWSTGHWMDSAARS